MALQSPNIQGSGINWFIPCLFYWVVCRFQSFIAINCFLCFRLTVAKEIKCMKSCDNVSSLYEFTNFSNTLVNAEWKVYTYKARCVIVKEL